MSNNMIDALLFRLGIVCAVLLYAVIKMDKEVYHPDHYKCLIYYMCIVGWRIIEIIICHDFIETFLRTHVVPAVTGHGITYLEIYKPEYLPVHDGAYLAYTIACFLFTVLYMHNWLQLERSIIKVVYAVVMWWMFCHLFCQMDRVDKIFAERATRRRAKTANAAQQARPIEPQTRDASC